MNILIHKYAAGLRPGKARLDVSNGSSAKIIEKGGIEVDIVSLDQYLGDKYKINYIKMDIEGGELDAINGAEQLIKSNKTDMAVAIYHKNYDIWVLANKIKEFMPDCKLYLRQHHHWGLELTLYVTN